MDAVCAGAVGQSSRGVVAKTMSGFAGMVKAMVVSMSPAMLVEGVGQGRTSCTNGDDSLGRVSGLLQSGRTVDLR